MQAPNELSQRLSTLSEPTRLRLLYVLAREELSVGELSRALQLPQSTVSRHLKQLLDGGWLEKRSAGTASFFLLAQPLPDEAAALWSVVAAELDASGAYAEDSLRVESVLARRELEGRAFFGRHAGRWAQLRRELFGEDTALPVLLSLLPPELVVADLGCGTGELVAALAPYARRVIGVDREAAMLEVARRRCAGLENAVLLEGGLGALPIPDEALDAALCTLVLHHVEDLVAAFADIARTLRPGGRLVVLDMVQHTRRAYRRSMGHRHLGFSEETLEALARGAGLILESYRRLPPDPQALGPGLFVARSQRPPGS